MPTIPALVFILCLVTSAACAWLLFRQYRKTPSGLLFWSALCFLALTGNNFLVVLDLVIFPEAISLSPWRHAASLLALGVLLYGFIWESN